MSLTEDPRQGVGARLKAERERVGMTQEAMGTAAGTTKQTQLRYENGMNSPNTTYLHELSGLGVDIGYVVTGYPSELRDDEAEMLSRYRAVSPELRRAALAMLASQSAQTGGGATITLHGANSGQVVGSSVNQGNVTFGGSQAGEEKKI